MAYIGMEVKQQVIGTGTGIGIGIKQYQY